jgi:hypothetical protein
MVRARHFTAESLFILLLASWSYVSAEIPLDAQTVLAKMREAYASVRDYQTHMKVIAFEGDGSSSESRFLYTFKKPLSIRLDFEAPHRGMVVIFPDEYGKVGVKPSGFIRFLRLHLEVDNSLLQAASGQSIDKTDMGLLIENISRSVGEGRRGPVEVTPRGGLVAIKVSAVNHFRKGIVTLYAFTIDRGLWLPVRIDESTPDGKPERTVVFDDLRINTGVTDNLFQLDARRVDFNGSRNGR